MPDTSHVQESMNAVRELSARGPELAPERIFGSATQAGEPLRRSPPLALREALVESSRFPHIRIVRDYAVLRLIGQLRHRQYVAAQAKRYTSIVLDADCLIEPSDFSAVNIYATDAAGITSALRIGDVLDSHNPYASLFRQAAERCRVPIELALTCSRLVRTPGHSGRHVVDLIDFVRWQTVRAGWRYCFMQTAERLVPFFRKLECRETGIWSEEPAAGRLQVLILDTADRPERSKEARRA